MWYPGSVSTEIIPTSGEPSYGQTTALSGRDYGLDFDFIARDGVHLLSLYLDSGELLVGGLPLLPGRFLLDGILHPDRPPGDLLVVADRDVPALGDFGTEAANLLYLTDEDLDTFRGILAGTETP